MGHLPPVPLYYPLQKTHVTIRDATVEDVTSRIMECLRCLSVSAVYDSERMTAKAETSNNVKFEIRLFSTTGETTTLAAAAAAAPGILVEVTRMTGCALSFQRCYRSIVRSVTFNQQQEQQTTSMRRKQQQLTMSPSSSKRTKINHDDDANSNNETTTAATATLSQALETSLSLLLKDRIDANRLGIESLRLLTDATSTRMAHCVAALLLYDDEDREEQTTILPTVVTQSLRLTVTSLITNGGRSQRRRGGTRHGRRTRKYGISSDEDEEDCDDAAASKEESDDDVTDDDYPSHLEDDFDRRHYDTMTNHALGILSNSLSHHSKNDHYRPLASCWTDDIMIDTLLRKIQSCPTKPHDAQLSLQCLAILELDRVGKKVLEARRGVLGDATRLSRAVGMCGHELLERESELMMMGLVLNKKGGCGGGGDGVGSLMD